MDRAEILKWLREESPAQLEVLWARADDVRLKSVGDEVHLRGLVEVSNHCVRACGYCGIRAANRAVERYRMTVGEVLECARQARGFGYGTVVLQAGEDPELTGAWVAEAVRRIKAETGLAVTLSLGERTEEELRLWRAAGADRYLLRFETSDRRLFEHIHPSLPGRQSNRIAMLGELRRIGYEVGSGVMIGIPGQGFETLADDIMLFSELDLDMIGVGPYIPHPGTPLGSGGGEGGSPAGGQVPNTEIMTYKVVALTRLACPRANIPSTTALATLNTARGRELGLMRGANIVMPNITPPQYRAKYEIYPNKACSNETAEACRHCLGARLASIGRRAGRGPGSAKGRAQVERCL